MLNRIMAGGADTKSLLESATDVGSRIAHGLAQGESLACCQSLCLNAHNTNNGDLPAMVESGHKVASRQTRDLKCAVIVVKIPN